MWLSHPKGAAGTWDCQRRVIVKAEHLEKGVNTRFVVTNLEGQPQQLYDELYCQRGQAENKIKEQQLCLFADRTSCHDFAANQLRVLEPILITICDALSLRAKRSNLNPKV